MCDALVVSTILKHLSLDDHLLCRAWLPSWSAASDTLPIVRVITSYSGRNDYIIHLFCAWQGAGDSPRTLEWCLRRRLLYVRDISGKDGESVYRRREAKDDYRDISSLLETCHEAALRYGYVRAAKVVLDTAIRLKRELAKASAADSSSAPCVNSSSGDERLPLLSGKTTKAVTPSVMAATGPW